MDIILTLKQLGELLDWKTIGTGAAGAICGALGKSGVDAWIKNRGRIVIRTGKQYLFFYDFDQKDKKFVMTLRSWQPKFGRLLVDVEFYNTKENPTGLHSIKLDLLAKKVAILSIDAGEAPDGVFSYNPDVAAISLPSRQWSKKLCLAASVTPEDFHHLDRATEVRVIALNPQGKRLSWSIGVPPDKI